MSFRNDIMASQRVRLSPLPGVMWHDFSGFRSTLGQSALQGLSKELLILEVMFKKQQSI